MLEYVCNTSSINFDGAPVNTYQVTVRTVGTAHVFSAIAASSADAFLAAATQFAEVPCGIAVRLQLCPLSVLRKLITPALEDVQARQQPLPPTSAAPCFVFLSGAKEAIPLHANDRRFFAVDRATVGQVL